MTRTVAVVLVVDVEDAADLGPLSSTSIANLVRARVDQHFALRVAYVEVHDDLDAVLDDATAAHYSRPETAEQARERLNRCTSVDGCTRPSLPGSMLCAEHVLAAHDAAAAQR